MSQLFSPTPNANKSRRGSAAVLSVALLTTLLIVSVIAIDYSKISTSRSELKRTADAAAMSGAWELFDGVSQSQDANVVEENIEQAASDVAAENKINSQAPVLTANSDIEIGYYRTDTPGQLDTSDPEKFNAVRVHVRKTEQSGGALPLFFGSITGKHKQSLQTNSTAALFKTIGGFRTPPDGSETINILPIALDEETWEKVVNNETNDNYKLVNGNVVSGSDGYCECSLYPQGTGAPGNRGTVDIGSSGNSTNDLKRQILHGISQNDMAELGKPLTFDSNGELELNGDTGLSAAIKAELAQIIGQTRIIPIFKKVQGNGNNAMYTIIRFEGVRILGVKLTGPPKKKHLTIQPAPVVARHSIFTEDEEHATHFLYTPVMLVD